MIVPLRLWMTPIGPNPWKVVMILEELGLTYEILAFKQHESKEMPFLGVNPNGRSPAIEDPNTALTLWESGAIILYLIEQYDTDKKLTYEPLIQKHQLNQWLMFQMSGQGPYFGQATWFNYLHPVKVPSAMVRYQDEAKRVLSVLEGVLSGKEWLVGDKCTFADLSFVPWNDRMDAILMITNPTEDKFEGYPNVKLWHERMIARPSWKKASSMRLDMMAKDGIVWPRKVPKYESNIL